jgi:hypothetical protein
LLENALHHTGADAKFPVDLEDAVAAGLSSSIRAFKARRGSMRWASILQPTQSEQIGA